MGSCSSPKQPARFFLIEYVFHSSVVAPWHPQNRNSEDVDMTPGTLNVHVFTIQLRVTWYQGYYSLHLPSSEIWRQNIEQPWEQWPKPLWHSGSYCLVHRDPYSWLIVIPIQLDSKIPYVHTANSRGFGRCSWGSSFIEGAGIDIPTAPARDEKTSVSR